MVISELVVKTLIVENLMSCMRAYGVDLVNLQEAKVSALKSSIWLFYWIENIKAMGFWRLFEPQALELIRNRTMM